jgi:transposase InsO family protein
VIAGAESLFGSLKIEQIFGMRYLIRTAARQDIVEFIEMFYNSRRRRASPGYISSMEFEQPQLWKKAAQQNVCFCMTTSTSTSLIKKGRDVKLCL